MKIDFSTKLSNYKKKTLFSQLDPVEQNSIESISYSLHPSFQEFKFLVDTSIDLENWSEEPLSHLYHKHSHHCDQKVNKERFIHSIKSYLEVIQNKATPYETVLNEKKNLSNKELRIVETEKKIYGDCPVASEKTLCCNLKTIDAVENCSFGCNYCSIQDFYNDEFLFDKNFVRKLRDIPIDPNKNYHFGTGQSSDSLAWGNKNGILEALCSFAREHSNIILEFKTKSKKINYFLQNEISKNIFCSWSLNPQIIIENEEKLTASLIERLNAARAVANKGICVAFHFHPIFYFENWRNEYKFIINDIKQRFHPSEVAYISFGSMTFIKPLIRKIRKNKIHTKAYQFEFFQDPHGKLSYPDRIKIELFSFFYSAFKEWHKKVFFYLCMERKEIWDKSLGFSYQSNDLLEEKMFKSVIAKI